VLFTFIVLAFLGFPSGHLRSALAGSGVPRGGHFGPFTDVLRRIWPCVTRKGAESLGTTDHPDITDKDRYRRRS